MKPKQIRTLAELAAVRAAKRSVVCPGTFLRKPNAAAWVMNLSGEMILRLIGYGLFEYTPEAKKPRTHWAKRNLSVSPDPQNTKPK